MRNRNRNRRKKEAICLGIALICGALLTGLLLVQRGMLVEARARRAGQELSREVLRFHVLADSDSPEDQQRKLEVKEALLAYMEEAMPLDADLEETCSWVRENLDSLEQTAEERLREEGRGGDCRGRVCVGARQWRSYYRRYQSAKDNPAFPLIPALGIAPRNRGARRALL